MKTKNKILTAAAVTFGVAAVSEWAISNNSLEANRIAVRSSKVPLSFDGFRIAHISDMHCSGFGHGNERLLRKIKTQYPDIVAITGDMIEDENSDFASLFNLIEKLVLKYPVYYVMGNHELMLGEDAYNSMMSQLSLCGATVMDNSSTVIKRNNDEIILTGLCNSLCFYAQRKKDTVTPMTLEKMKEMVGEADTSRYNILLAHSPFSFDAYSEWGADLTLSGHVHGGMIRLPKIGGIFSPDFSFFPEYQGGLYDDGKNYMVVNKGLGSARIPVRFFNKPEISVVTLKSKRDMSF
ncbi:MAG: metallophosphoesterase [Clostridiales bacterium]|jgi:predicted MPP superfamily phosphohydrolase|nr:metallophosphoesterase [Clostridiales bacterium]